MVSPASPRIGLWGTFDVDNYGDLLLGRIALQELSSRLPGSEIRLFSPFGWFHPVGFEGVAHAAPLGEWTVDRVADLAAELDCVVIGGGDLLHDDVDVLAHAYRIDPEQLRRRHPSRFFIDGLGPALERERPVIWSGVGVPADLSGDLAARVRAAARARPYVAVRDEISRARLEDAGVEGEVAVVPDSGLLVSRVFPSERFGPALDRLVRMDRFPRSGSAVVVQANGRLVPWVRPLVEAIQATFEGASVVTLEIAPCHGDGEFAHAMHAALDGSMPAYHVPGTARLEEIAAAIHSAAAFMGSSLHGSITAIAYGRPYAMLHGVGLSKIDGFAALVGGEEQVIRRPEEIHEVLGRIRAADPKAVPMLTERVDAHFDRVARIAAGSVGRVPLEADGRVLEIEGRVLLGAIGERERRHALERDSLLARIHRTPEGEPTGAEEIRLARALRRARVATPVHYLSQTDSTNARVLQMAMEGAPDWTVIVAGHQTEGRGRLGRRWLDIPGTSLLCSVLLRPTGSPSEVQLLTLAAAVAMIDSAGLSSLGAKWPNDLVVGERKCGGILAETKVQDGGVRHVALGVGMNVSATAVDLPREIRDNATSLAIEGANVSLEDLLAGFLGSLQRLLASPAFTRQVVDSYRPRCRTLGRVVRAVSTAGTRIEGRAIDVDEDGSLLVESNGRVEHVAFGLVEHLR